MTKLASMFVLAALVTSCGGRVVVDGEPTGGGSTASSASSAWPKCAIGKCGDTCQICDATGCTTGVCDLDALCRVDAPVFECPDPCGGLACGDPCAICDQSGCDPSGHCAQSGTCELGAVDCGPIGDGTCATLPCGADCAQCGEVECFIGQCDASGTCEVFGDVTCD